MNLEKKGHTNGYWMPTVVFSEESRIKCEKIQKEFAKENIDARKIFGPLSSSPMFKDCKSNTNAYSISERGINLPSFHEISSAEKSLVIEVVNRLLP